MTSIMYRLTSSWSLTLGATRLARAGERRSRQQAGEQAEQRNAVEQQGSTLQAGLGQADHHTVTWPGVGGVGQRCPGFT